MAYHVPLDDIVNLPVDVLQFELLEVKLDDVL